MNKKNLQKLLDHLKSQTKLGFNMENWFEHNGTQIFLSENALSIMKEHPCGTNACLAGHAAILAWEEGKYLDLSPADAAEKWLDLRDNEAGLFYGSWFSLEEEKSLDELTLEEAITELEYRLE